MNELTAKEAQREFPPIPLTWQKTTCPRPPVSLPIGVEVRVEHDGLQIHAERRGSIGADEQKDLQLEAGEILKVSIILRPDVPDDADWQWVRDDDLSCATIRHRDPFDVEDFESTFTSDKAYWLKMLARGIRDRLGIEVTIEEPKSKKQEPPNVPHIGGLNRSVR